jgi:hypothetical protein
VKLRFNKFLESVGCCSVQLMLLLANYWYLQRRKVARLGLICTSEVLPIL